MTVTLLPATLRYLPLVPRPRPAALPLPQRLTELHDLLHQAERTPDAEEGITRACEAMNKAALIASDIGNPDLAAALCWQQYETFLPTTPLTAKVAIFALQPLVNLARLAIRTGDPSGAYTMLKALFAATDHSEPVQILGRVCAVGALVTSDEERAELRRFLWAILLADGTRALCAANRWPNVAHHLHRYNGIGTRLLDGRQVAVLAALHLKDPETATRILARTDCVQPWEHAVAFCLATATQLVSGQDSTKVAMDMADTILHLPPESGGPVFTVRLGALACELAPEQGRLASHVVSEVVRVDDAHAASTVLATPVIESRLTTGQKQLLRERVARAQPDGNADTSAVEARVKHTCNQATRLLHSYLRGMETK